MLFSTSTSVYSYVPSSPYHDPRMDPIVARHSSEVNGGGGRKENEGYSIVQVPDQSTSSAPGHTPLLQDQFKDKPEKSTTTRQKKSDHVPTVWTPAAKIFIWSISLFAFSTVALLIALEIIQAQHSELAPNVILQPLTIASELFLLGSAYMGIKSQNMVEIIAVVLFNIYLVVSGIIEASQRTSVLKNENLYGGTSTAILAILWTVPAIDIVFHAGVDWSAWKLYKELGWMAYKRVSADLAKRRLYQRFLIFSSLLLFATFFATAQAYVFAATRGRITITQLHQSATEWLVGHSVFWVTYLVAMAFAYWSSRREKAVGMAISIFLQLAHLGWQIRVVVDFGQHLWGWFNLPGEAEMRPFKESFMPHKTLFQIIIALLVFLATLVYSALIWYGFGRGLKEIHTRRPNIRGNDVDLSLE